MVFWWFCYFLISFCLLSYYVFAYSFLYLFAHIKVFKMLTNFVNSKNAIQANGENLFACAIMRVYGCICVSMRVCVFLCAFFSCFFFSCRRRDVCKLRRRKKERYRMATNTYFIMHAVPCKPSFMSIMRIMMWNTIILFIKIMIIYAKNPQEYVYVLQCRCKAAEYKYSEMMSIVHHLAQYLSETSHK